MVTDKQKVLELLRQAGPKGVHSFILIQEAHTYRVGARVCDLKKDGYNILPKPEKMGDSWGVRYFLLSEPPKPEKPVYILIDSLKDRRLNEDYQEIPAQTIQGGLF